MAGNGELNKLHNLVHDRAKIISIKDIKNVQDFRSNVEAKSDDITVNYARLKDQLLLAVNVIDDYFSGACNEIPLYSISLLSVLVMYFLDDNDLIPDSTHGIGYLDDFMVGETVFESIRDDLEEYCEVKKIDLSKCYP